MHIPGHLSVGWMIALGALYRHSTTWARRWFWCVASPCMLGALTPDLFDKSFYWLGISKFGRTLGHSAMLWACASLIVLWLCRGKTALNRCIRWWIVGAWSHLMVDAINDVCAGILWSRYVMTGWWAWPFCTPDQLQVILPSSIYGPCRTCWTPLEYVTMMMALILAFYWVYLCKKNKKPTLS